jgi:hypothetical protein
MHNVKLIKDFNREPHAAIFMARRRRRIAQMKNEESMLLHSFLRCSACSAGKIPMLADKSSSRTASQSVAVKAGLPPVKPVKPTHQKPIILQVADFHDFSLQPSAFSLSP